MIVLPEMTDKVIARPGSSEFEVPYLVPDRKTHRAFWGRIYEELRELGFYSPVGKKFDKHINPDVGYFAYRDHPTGKQKPYYHVGVQMEFDKAREIKPIARGVLEYSGYGAINGYYVLLSHPQIQTEDGYVLHSMYCHLKKPKVSFSSYQKMLREISLGSYPIVDIPSQEVLGMSGNSGVVEGEKSKLYLQLDFRKYGESSVSVDPLPVFTGEFKKNTSSKRAQARKYRK